MTTIELDRKTIAMGMAFGLVKPSADGFCYELTPEGSAYFKEWADKQLRQLRQERGEHRCTDGTWQPGKTKDCAACTAARPRPRPVKRLNES